LLKIYFYRWFDRLIMLAIVLNSICLSLFDYTDREVTSEYNLFLNWLGDGFTLFFLFEALIKVFAMGFIIHKKAYLRDGWNFIDFLIVIFG